jgi:hypothetical protein
LKHPILDFSGKSSSGNKKDRNLKILGADWGKKGMFQFEKLCKNRDPSQGSGDEGRGSE